MPKLFERRDLWCILLLMFIVTLIPLIVYLRLVDYGTFVNSIHGRINSANFFTYIRSLWLYLLTGTAMVLFWIRQKPVDSWTYRPIGFFLFFAVASTVFSLHPAMAFWGDIDRNEGLLTQLCYMAILFLTINLVKGKFELKLFLGGVLLTAAVLSIIGFLQFFGYDYLYGGFADKFLIPDHFQKIAPTFSVKKLDTKPDSIFLTFGNGNYTGSYMAMLFSLTIGLIIGLKHKINFLLVPLNLLLFFNLVGSKSRAGMLGAAIAFLLMLFLFRHRLMGRLKFLVILPLSYILIIIGMDAYALKQDKRFIDSSLNRPAIAKKSLFGNFEDLKLEKDQASVTFDGLELKIRFNETKIEFYDARGELVPHRLIKKSDLKKEDQAAFPTELSDLPQDFSRPANSSSTSGSTTFLEAEAVADSRKPSQEEEKFLVLFPEKLMRGYIIFAWPEKNVLQIGRGGISFYLAYTEKGFQILDQLGRPKNIESVESFGFSGLEKFGSGRGYIWSRTLPMLKKTILIGYGPDTFFLHYPNHDYLGKLRHISKGIQRVIDKPHNMFLQIGVNTGVLSLLALMWLFARYFLLCFRTRDEQFESQNFAVILKSINLALIAYLIAGIFNDSIISIAPVSWCLLGLGVALQNFPAKSFESPENGNS